MVEIDLVYLSSLAQIVPVCTMCNGHTVPSCIYCTWLHILYVVAHIVPVCTYCTCLHKMFLVAQILYLYNVHVLPSNTLAYLDACLQVRELLGDNLNTHIENGLSMLFHVREDALERAHLAGLFVCCLSVCLCVC